MQRGIEPDFQEIRKRKGERDYDDEVITRDLVKKGYAKRDAAILLDSRTSESAAKKLAYRYRGDRYRSIKTYPSFSATVSKSNRKRRHTRGAVR